MECNDVVETESKTNTVTKILHFDEEKNPYLWYFHQKVGDFIQNRYFQIFIMILIIINALTMGLATYPLVRFNPHAQYIFDQIDLVFLIIFTIELGLHFIYYGIYLFCDGWLVFDFAIVMSSWFIGTLKIIRSFRIFRSLRLVSRIHALRVLIDALRQVLPQLFVIALLLCINFYIFSVLFTQLFKNLYRDDVTTWNYFSRLDNSLFSLFQIMTLNDWSPIARETMSVYSWAWFPFIVFITLQSIVMMNLIIAALCNSMTIVRENEKSQKKGNDEGGSNSHIDSLQEEVNYLNQSLDEIIEFLNRNGIGCPKIEKNPLNETEVNDKQEELELDDDV